MRKTKRKLPRTPEFLLKREKTSSDKRRTQWQIGPKKGLFLPHAQSNNSWGLALKLLKIGA
ncbi:MAG: hypothetical protein DRQ88_05585 [Epsilonproteobacteria bacterium]|nr:MAG: hypothetical protein DRQ88_05585 [Campylobacterota bacterium]